MNLCLLFLRTLDLSLDFLPRHLSLSGLKRQIMKTMRMKMTVKTKNVRVVMIAMRTVMKKMMLRSLSFTECIKQTRFSSNVLCHSANCLEDELCCNAHLFKG